MTRIDGVNTVGDTYEFHVTSGLADGANIITVYADDLCGNVGDDDESVNFSCPDAVITIITPTENELICGMYTFEAEAVFDRQLPEFECVEFYFDGAQSPAFIDCDGGRRFFIVCPRLFGGAETVRASR